MPWGVGVIGAGPGVAALHLPTLQRLGDRFTVGARRRPWQRPRRGARRPPRCGVIHRNRRAAGRPRRRGARDLQSAE